jgi:hypothetical protein
MNYPDFGEIFRVVWTTYGASLLKRSGFWAQKRWQKFHWEAAVAGYADHIHRTHGTIRILTMAAPVPVKGLYVELRILEKPLSFSRVSVDTLRLRGPSWEDDPHFGFFRRVDVLPRSATALVKQPQARLFVLGSPGAGKTTLLKSLALKAIDGRFESIPIFVSLRELSDSGLSLEAFIAQQFSICEFPDHQGYVSTLLRNGRALLLLDGLDEVNEEGDQRQTIAAEVSNFVERYHSNRYIVTARVGAADDSFHNFRFVEIARFNYEQIANFATKWFYDEPELGARFLSELHRHDNLLELAQTPLLLTLLCLTFEDLKTFPQHRAELYKEAFEVLLRKWDDTRRINRDEFYGNLSYERRRHLLMTIAYQTLEDGELFFDTETIAQRISAFLARLPEMKSATVTIDDGIAVLKAIEAQHGVLSERAVGIYAFSHKTFLEFFAARYIVESGRRDTISSLASQILDRRWREVALLTAGLIGDADEMILQMAVHSAAPLANRVHLRKLMASVTKKVDVITSIHSQIGVWCFYLSMFLDRHVQSTPDDNRELRGAQKLFHSATRDLARASGFEGLFQLFDGRSEGQAHDVDIRLDIALEKSIEALRSGYSEQYLQMHVERVTELARKLGQDWLAANVVDCLSSRASLSQLVSAGDCMEAIASKHRGLELDWLISAEDYEVLVTFLQGLGLIAECLDVASLGNREQILHQLLLAADGKTSEEGLI